MAIIRDIAYYVGTVPALGLQVSIVDEDDTVLWWFAMTAEGNPEQARSVWRHIVMNAGQQFGFATVTPADVVVSGYLLTAP